MYTWLSVTAAIWCYGTTTIGSTAEQILQSASDLEKEEADLFVEFVNKYDKPYKLGSDEFIERLSVFKKSLERHYGFNQGQTTNHSSSALYGITKFADLTPEEFKAKYLTDIKNSSHVFSKYDLSGTINVHNFSEAVPKKVDWRQKGIISPVKNQLQCGACWAFSSVETVESMYALKTKRPVPDLSVQEVIDCAKGSLGCDGGDTCTALDWMVKSKYPLVPDPEYPLTDKSQSCHILTNGTAGVIVKNHTCFKQFASDESKMLWLLANVGPLTVSVDATTWNDYLGGIIQYHCRGRANNHAVQIVGYDLTGEIPFYIVRNSWGTDFGNAGYLYIKYGGNVCGIAREVSTVTV